MLPPFKKWKTPRVDSGVGPRNPPPPGSKWHYGFDINYDIGGPEPDKYVPMHSPVNGVVDIIEPSFIAIKDDGEYYHIFHHVYAPEYINVKLGQRVSVGRVMGLMGKHNVDNVHMHYEIHNKHWTKRKGDRASVISPDDYWAGKKQTFVNLPRDEKGLPITDSHVSDSITAQDIGNGNDTGHNQVEEKVGGTTILGAYAPRMAAVALESGAIGALIPNRVPEHEPWARVMSVNTPNINGPTDEIYYNSTNNPQHDATSDVGAKLIGKLDGDVEIIRGPFWRR